MSDTIKKIHMNERPIVELGMGKTAIEWSDETINPFVGCSKVSRACDRCYASDFAFNIEHVMTKNGKAVPKNYKGVTREMRDGSKNWTGVINYDASVMKRLSPHQAPKRFFANSMSDFFHPKMKIEWLQEVFSEMGRCSQHTFLVLTKRPENALAWAPLLEWHPNIWLGATVENDHPDVLARVDHLRFVPAARRFLSCEPLTADIADELDLSGIDWVIVGGETAPKNAPAHVKAGVQRLEPAHALALRDLCQRSGVSFFFKQWGAFSEAGIRRGRGRHGEGLGGKVYHSWPTDAQKAAANLYAVAWSEAASGGVKLRLQGNNWLGRQADTKSYDGEELAAWMKEHAKGQHHGNRRKGIAFLQPNEAFFFRMRFA